MSGTAFSSTQLLTQFLQDEAFLLRCATTFDWAPLVDRCTLIVEIFTTSILDRHEANHKQIQRSAKRQLTQTDNWRNTPLHMACYNKARYEVIEAILEAAAATETPLTEYRTWKNDQSTPLQISCGMGAPHRVIQLLINPPGDLLGGKAIRMASVSGKGPLFELCHRYDEARKHRSYRRNSPSLDEVNMMESRSYSDLFQDFWEAANHVIRGSWMYERPGEHYISILHAVAFMAECCPIEFTDLMLRTNMHMVAFPSRDGILPLHLAVTAVRPETHALQQTQRAHVVAKLCDLFPLAVQKCCPGSGRTPFCEAIASGLPWVVLQTLLQHQPDAMYARDLKTHLHPFLLAASVQQEIMEEDESPVVVAAADVAQVDTIYNLLQTHPQVLNSLIVL